MINDSPNKSKDCLQVDSFEVVVIKDPKLRPFFNVFDAVGQNIKQQKLGKIFGIIQVDDTSENSAYLPNMLTQIIKKEYFKNKNKSCGKSFEIALHKINLALTELTQHEIVEWMGNLNAAIGVICENEIHFAQIGQGRILFLKNEKISNIKSASSKNEEYHPMKTFASISAGKIEANNKIIFTLKETFDTLPLEELTRHFKTFDSVEFDNIISATLKNEALKTGMIVLNIKNQPKIVPDLIIETKENPEIEKNLNFFGETKKEKKLLKGKNQQEKPEEAIILEKKKIKIEDPNKSPFENEPEIYVKEDETETQLKSKNKENGRIIKEKYNQFLEKFIFPLKNKFFQKKSEKLKDFFKKIPEITLKFCKKIDKNKMTIAKNKLRTSIQKTLKLLPQKNKVDNIIKNLETKVDIKINKKISTRNDVFEKFSEKIKLFFKKIKIYIKDNFFKKSLIVISILIILITLFSLIIKNRNNKLESINKPLIKNEIIDKKIDFEIKNLRTLITLNRQIKNSTFLKNDLYLLTEKESLIKFSIRNNIQTEILLPKELKNPQYLSSMESLQLIFIVSQNQTYSYSPITNSFSKNIIAMPSNFKDKSVGIGSYLTYLYLLDQESNQIYRYPRAPGGFGVVKAWLKEKVDLSNAISLDVSDSIYIAFNNGKIRKYFEYTQQKEFNLEEGFVPDKIRVKINKNEIFALDKKQGKILMLSENNGQQVFFQDKKFKDANDFSIDFENRKIFVITEKKEIITFDYQ